MEIKKKYEEKKIIENPKNGICGKRTIKQHDYKNEGKNEIKSK